MAEYASNLLINVNDLLFLQGVEKQRVEFKKAWHNKKESGPRGTYWQVLHSICAFANDYYNDNGGYIIIGVDEKENWEDTSDDRQIILPPFGVPAKDLDIMQKEIMGACRANIKPDYYPILSPEVVEMEGERRHLLVISAMASDNRPHNCRETEKGDNRCYYIRRASQTVKASPDEERLLLTRHSEVPFDDRRALDTECGKQLSEEDIDFTLVKKFLNGINSKLLDQGDKEPCYFYERLKLVRSIGDKRLGKTLVPVFAPRNVALLFFHPTPHEFFTGAKTEIATYTHEDDSDEVLLEGPIDQQIENTLELILKTTKEEAQHAFVAYPVRALREAVVNAFHHRGYEECYPHPIKIHIKPNGIDVISYPGPTDPSLKEEHFSEGSDVPYVPSRNRRIAEFLKERKLAEGRFTGVKTIFKTMKRNKNPKPSFHFSSSHFHVHLPGHPRYIAYSVLRDVNNLCAKGDKHDAVEHLKKFLDKHLLDEHPFEGSEMLVKKLLELHDNDKSHQNVKPYDYFISDKQQRLIPLITELCQWCEAKNPDISRGVAMVKALVEDGAKCEDLNSVITKAAELCKKRGKDGRLVLESVQKGHKLFEAMGKLTQEDGYVAFQFAHCKFILFMMAKQGVKKRERKDLLPYLKEAEDYVNKAKLLTTDSEATHLATQYRLLGYIQSQLLSFQKSTEEQLVASYDMARRYHPEIQINSLFIPPKYRAQYRFTPTE